MPIFIPPTFIAAPALLARFVQLRTRMIRLPASAPMMLNRFMKTMIGLGDAPLAVVTFSAHSRRSGEEQKSAQYSAREHCFAQPNYLGLKFCPHPSLL
jgi:hypothetical protein